jgi:hypothetical protein
MFELWTSLMQNIGQSGSEGGKIVRDDELPEVGRVTVEQKTRSEPELDYYCVTIGVYGLLVHTAFFNRWDDAVEAADLARLLIQTLRQPQ